MAEAADVTINSTVAKLLNLEKMRNVALADGESREGLNALKTAHAVSNSFWGPIGEQCESIYGKDEAGVARTTALIQFMHPVAAALTLGHTALAATNGARILGNTANPNPAGCFPANVGLDSVGKSRQTGLAKKICEGVHALKPEIASARGGGVHVS